MATAGSDQPVTFDVEYREGLNRLTTLFRYFTALPHAIVVALWAYAVSFASIGQWFVIVFTGKRSRGIWEFSRQWLAYASRVNSYSNLNHDVWPRFGSEWGDEPVAFDHRYVEEGNRLTTALRIIWIIPALIVAVVLGIGLAFVLLVAWFAILFTGRYPRGMFDFSVRVMRFALNLTAYECLMTDVYPRYQGSEPVGVLPPGDHGVNPSVGRGWSTPPPMSPPPAPGQPLPPPSGPPA
jgi:hypothetical protein